MKSEALRNIRTMRQVKTSSDVLGKQKPRTTNSLSKTSEEIEHLESIADRRLEQILSKERARFVAFDVSVEKSRQRVIKSREKLAATINKNQALTELRHELQRERWEEKDSTPPKVEQPIPEQNLHRIELRY